MSLKKIAAIHAAAIKEAGNILGNQDNAKLAIMYSGGKDSTNVLCSVAEAYPHAELFLMLCNNGHFYPQDLKDITLKNIAVVLKSGALKSINYSVLYLDCKEILMNLGMRSLHDDMKKYPTCYLCCACKLIMHFVCACCCRHYGIKKLLDGYNHRQRYYPEQVPAFHSIVSKIVWERYQVQTISPLYKLLADKDAANFLLTAFGLIPDTFDREKGGQSVCSLGGCFKAPRTSAGRVDRRSFGQFEQGVIKYTNEKIMALCSDSVIWHNRESGPLSKPPYQSQIAKVVDLAEIISRRSPTHEKRMHVS